MKKLLLTVAALAFIITATYQNASAVSWNSSSNVSPTVTDTNTDPTGAAPTTNNLQERLQERKSRLETARGERQEAALERIKTRLTDAINRMIRHLNNLKTRVQNHPNIDDDAETQIIARLDRDIDWLNDRLAELEAISSIEELRTHREQIRGYWQKIRAEAKYITGHILVARAKHFVQRIEKVIEVTRNKMAELEADTSTTENLLNQAETYLDTAKNNFELALEEFEKIETVRGSFDQFQTGRDYLKEARQEAVSALRLVRQAVMEVKKLSKSELVD